MKNAELNFTDPSELRRMAEEKVKNQSDIPEIPEATPDIRKLLHELHVHQIELEMQNEELKQAYEIMEAALKKYTLLYDFAPAGYLTLDSDCSICDLNFTAAEMLGDKRFALLNSNFRLFITDESKQEFDTFFSKITSGQGKDSCEVTLGFENKKLCKVYIEGVVTGDDQKCLLAVIDTSFFKQL
jgi:PAS domain-containing protein